MRNNPSILLEQYLAAFNDGTADQPSVWCRINDYSYSSLSTGAKRAGVSLPSRSVCKLDKELNWDDNLDLIDAHLLGDASLVNPKKRETSVIQNCCKHKEYLEWLCENTPFWAGCNVWFVSSFDKRTNETYERYWIKSRSSHYLEKQRSRWYPNGKKSLPSDFVLTSRGLLRLFLEDGCRIRYGISLALNDFVEEDIIKIKDRLEGIINHQVALQSENSKVVKLYIPSGAVPLFYNVIGDSPVSCFNYKWRLGR